MSTSLPYKALIRTHHITSRKKVANLKKAASNFDVFALIKYGGTPGIMYVEGGAESVKNWVAAVHRLRYKDYHLAARPSLIEAEAQRKNIAQAPKGLKEVSSIKEFSFVMEARGVLDWWRKAMDYLPRDE
ncbi:hypothetical protein K490DRAFT_62209 [Saccharata proteae CBS 121410]|uniref:Uncharacterized protein n=1 Tax=Saccharata proteae CBS 121410 TaxID=1314787 RepID=A0A9P4I0L0_9PEZI|nr:hypothetical protein K490DRAFT_62209 [Saccharata proteae CBS 121410]